jgi:hypothetical protein
MAYMPYMMALGMLGGAPKVESIATAFLFYGKIHLSLIFLKYQNYTII